MARRRRRSPTVGALRAVPAAEWPDICAATAVAAAVEVGLRAVTLPRLARVLGTPMNLSSAGTSSAERASLTRRDRRRAWAADRVLRHWPFGDTCLRRALVLGWLLRHRSPVLRVGVAKVDGEVRAHAWLVIDGRSLDPTGAASFAPLRLAGAEPRGGQPRPPLPRPL
ncbi:lasso peptide biosynthesis B2 protein [Georgenia yuyongxinii]